MGSDDGFDAPGWEKRIARAEPRDDGHDESET
jgi:hypothetical protein